MSRLWVLLALLLPAAASAAGPGFGRSLSGSETFSQEFWRRQGLFLGSAGNSCAGEDSCGRQVSMDWLADRQVTVVSRAVEQTILEHYGLRSWARGLAQGSWTPQRAGASVVVGAAMLATDGLHARFNAGRLRFSVDLAAARRIHHEGGKLLTVEVSGRGTPLSVTAAWGRRAPTVGASYRLRY